MENLLKDMDVEDATALASRVISETKRDLDDRREWDEKIEIYLSLIHI